jgi:probable DNA repair protein
MYDWLDGTLDESTCLVTANRRLSRLLQEAWAARRVAAGDLAWRTPVIQPWQGWLGGLIASAERQDQLPTRINAQQSQLLWDRCLRKELDDAITGVPALVRLARDAWQRLADARVGIRDVAKSALSEDHRLFAAAAGRYLAVLDNESWVDEAGLGELALRLIREEQVALQARYVFAGFERLRPIMAVVQEALRDRGCEVISLEPVAGRACTALFGFEARDAELRAAGAWARTLLADDADARVAVIVPGLENSATRDLRLLRDACVPGWQYGPQALREVVDVSYGRRLGEYPAVAVALLALRWLVGELSSGDVSMLLQSPVLGSGEAAARSRLELRLRQLPDRAWSPSMLTGALRGARDAANASDWLARIAAFSKRRRDLPPRASPATWVLVFDETLDALGWPGPGTLNSAEFQLINRWRELLNEFARLDLVSASMTARGAIRQLELMAGEAVFQPESRHARVRLMGPLEALGAEFDAVWITGLNAENWPPAGNPSALLSRILQRQHAMPDATPEDTRQFAEATLQHLLGCAPEVVCSYAQVADDAEQTVSDLLGDVEVLAPGPDHGWHAAGLAGTAQRVPSHDAVPAVAGERIHGGAGTIQRQLTEPFSAFAYGRLGIRSIDRQALGIPPLLRGNLVHDALYRLYQDLPSAARLREIRDDALAENVAAAVAAAVQRYERHADPVLLRLLALEKERIEGLVAAFVRLDRKREDFEVAALEGELELRRGPLRLRLRFDRIDRYADGGVAIIDYKTGAAKQLLLKNGTVSEAQLFVYARACKEPVVALALANIDSRETGFSGAGRGFSDETEWPVLLAEIGAEIDRACDELAAGDVRIIADQGAANARRLNLLSRYTELRRDSR